MEKVTYEAISDKYTEEITKNSIGLNQSNAEIVLNPSDCVMPAPYKDYIERIHNFKVLPDDTWIVTYPKCGTTWTQEMVWLLKNNLDYEAAKRTYLRFRVPFFEFETILSKVGDPNEFPSTIEMAENLTSPRCIKSHLPMELLPKQLWTVKPKIVYVVRDPRDVAISYYHHYRLWNGYRGKLEDFVDVFLNDRIVYSPFWGHVLGFLDLKDKSHILINTFEEMKKSKPAPGMGYFNGTNRTKPCLLLLYDLAGIIRRTAKFLDVEITDEQVEQLREHLSFKKMKENDSVNYMDLGNEVKKGMKADETDENLNFIRKGESGGWKNIFGKDTLEKFKAWNEKHLKGRDFQEYPWS